MAAVVWVNKYFQVAGYSRIARAHEWRNHKAARASHAKELVGTDCSNRNRERHSSAAFNSIVEICARLRETSEIWRKVRKESSRVFLKPTQAAMSGSMAPVAVPQPSSSLLSSDGGLVTATDPATDGDVERPQSSGLAMDIHVPGYESVLNMTATTEPQTVAEESEDLQQKHKHQRHRTSFHYQPAKNWMNDPNAPMYYKGYYHLFYQYNPHAAVWGNITWGHAVSEDLIHWQYLEDALEPDQWYDAMGVWSGSATIDNDGIPFILYTGGSGRVEHISEQLQCMAVPADPTDPLLRKWVKVANNPIIARPLDVGEQDFRDPTTAWQQSDGTWIFTVGAKRGSTGVALQYRSKDTKNWELEEKLLYSGNSHGMWECVDFFPVDYHTPTTTTVPLGDTQKYIFKISLFDEKQDYYIVGTYDELAQKFSPDHPDHDIGLGFLLDYGSYYASKSFFDPVKNRRIMWAWVPESCTQEMDIQKGWSSVLGIPRTLVLESKTGGANLLQWPIEETDSLRGCKISQTDVKLDAGAIVEIKGAAGDQLDVEVVFDYPDVSSVQAADEAKFNNGYDFSQAGYANQGIFGPFGLLVLTDKNFQEQTAVFFYIVHSKDGQWTTRFCNDQSRSSLLAGINKPIYSGDVKVLPTEDFLALRVLVDRSIVESFVQGGRMTITSRVYPSVAVDKLANLYLFNNGLTPINVRSIAAYPMTQVAMYAI